MLNPNQLVSWEIDEQQKPIKEGEGVRGNVVGAGGIGVAVGGSGVEVLRNLCDGWEELK